MSRAPPSGAATSTTRRPGSNAPIEAKLETAIPASPITTSADVLRLAANHHAENDVNAREIRAPVRSEISMTASIVAAVPSATMMLCSVMFNPFAASPIAVRYCEVSFVAVIGVITSFTWYLWHV